MRPGDDDARKRGVQCLFAAVREEGAFLRSAEVRGVLDKMAAVLDKLPSGAARHRLLRVIDVEQFGLTKFRRDSRNVPMRQWLEWSFSHEWDPNRSLRALVAVYDFLGHDAGKLKQRIWETQSLRKRAHELARAGKAGHKAA